MNMLHDLDISYFIQDIENYIKIREQEGNKISFFGGYSKNDKLAVASKLLSFLKGLNVDFSNQEISILRNGRLGEICKKFAKGHGFSSVTNLFCSDNFKIIDIVVDNYFKIIYEIVEHSSQHGIANCSQTANRISEKLSDGRIHSPTFRERFPGKSVKVFEYYLGKKPEEFLININMFLGEGQHCQVFAGMVGYVKEKIKMGHYFNAIKILGQVKLIDTYKGWSKESWLNESWKNPEKYSEGFYDFFTSKPEISCYSWGKRTIK